MSNNAWAVELYDSTKLLWSAKYPVHRLSEERVKALLQLLVSKYLSPDEIGASVLNKRRGTPKALGLLEVTKESDNEKRRSVFVCGENPFATATVVRGVQDVH